MAKCEYFQNGGWSSDRCIVKGKIKGQDSDKIGSETLRSFCSYEDGYKKCPFYAEYQEQQKSDCFLTSACVQARELPDNCAELTVLRRFRDDWLRSQPFGETCIAEYYKVAPVIVRRIDERQDTRQIYDVIYTRVIRPCVRMIESHDNMGAYRLYRKAVVSLMNFTGVGVKIK